ncbi:MAG: type VI secretion system baseplate subunit TssG, partial [Polyangiaceae bacterium]|nr:type VI secretion system baseplate subunit TssG [Polyangiaceae bacterium]
PLLAARARGERTLRLTLACALEEWLLPTEASVRIKLFAGGYAPIESDQQTLLGRANHVLGASLFLGRRVYDRAGRFTVEIGPLDKASYGAFRPGGEPLRRIRAVVALVCREPLDYDVELELAPDAAERYGLDGRSALGSHTRLAGGSATQVTILRDVGKSP